MTVEAALSNNIFLTYLVIVGSILTFAGVVLGVASLAGLILALRALLGMLAGPLAGAVSDWLEDRWPVVRVGILLGTIGFLLLALPGGLREVRRESR